MTLLDMIQTMLARRQALDEERAGITQELEAAYEAINRTCGAMAWPTSEESRQSLRDLVKARGVVEALPAQASRDGAASSQRTNELPPSESNPSGFSHSPADRPSWWRDAMKANESRVLANVEAEAEAKPQPATLAEAVERSTPAPAVGQEPPARVPPAFAVKGVALPEVDARRQRIFDYVRANGHRTRLMAKDIASALGLALQDVHNDLQVLKRKGFVDPTFEGWRSVGARPESPAPEPPPLRAKEIEAAKPVERKAVVDTLSSPKAPTVTSSGVCVERRCSKCCRKFMQTSPADFYCKDCHEARKKERPAVRPKDPDLEPVWNGAKA